MKDYFHKILKAVDHNRGVVLAAIVLGCITVWGVGCEAQTVSLRDPAVKVTRQQFGSEAVTAEVELAQRRIRLHAELEAFNAEVDAVNEKVEAGIAELDRQDAVKKEIFDLAGSVVTQWVTGDVSAGSLIAALISFGGLAFGCGTAVDSRRKDLIIKAAKTKTDPSTE